MIDLIFYYGSEIVLVRIVDRNVYFSTSTFGAMSSSIEGLKLDKAGAIKEWPDLENNPEWKQEAIKRFKEKIASFRIEDDAARYIIEDLKQYGYVPKWKQKQGFRKEKIS